MYSNRKKIAALSVMALFLLAGCAESDYLVTDAGSGKKKEIPKEEYLQVDAKRSASEAVYTLHTLERGSFAEEMNVQVLQPWYGEMEIVCCQLGEVTASFNQYELDLLAVVQEGDTLASVYTDVKGSTLLEAQIRLERLKQRYQEAETQMLEDLKDNRSQKEITYAEYRRRVLDVQYKQRQQDWEFEKYNYENQIRKAEKRLESLRGMEGKHTIDSPKEGVLLYVTQNYLGVLAQTEVPMTRRFTLEKELGDELREGDVICSIIPTDILYRFAYWPMPYGTQKEINVNGTILSARVVAGGTILLYGNLDNDDVVLRADDVTAVEDPQERALRKSQLNDISYKNMENVILVPAKAVTKEGDRLLVTVMKEDGTLVKTCFVSGGYNGKEYWVLEGLSEGMKVVY